ncbi:hypothetical protein OEZ85_011400 [Tetradesmus obliquus]|uniref:Uncharacterized protein n=1 Tax=Tetradesmus obliquus TaxID=3088 RepID=A0ABY8TQ88_TETOB|nr:hypothetical protein OEZ85_011400 [Tetradesmus obliquus]
MSCSHPASHRRGRHEAENTSSGPSDAPAAVANEYELERLRRIQRNKQVLAELGLENAATRLLEGSSKHAQQRAAKRQPCQSADGEQQEEQQQPARRSRRLASQPAEAAPEHQELDPGGCSKPGPVERRSVFAAASKLDVNALLQHNMYRMNSMSEKALITRAWKITNVSKLQSFVQVLEAAGKEAVLQEARKALQQLTGSSS